MMDVSTAPLDPTDAAVVVAIRGWIERAVIGLNLCPFARAPFAAGRVRLCVSAAQDTWMLASDLRDEALLLSDAAPAEIETTLLILPHVLGDFLDYNDFLDDADAILVELNLDGVLQIASFHPQYRFAGAEPDAIENFTNRSPYPILHLLREDSVARAVDAMADPEVVYRRNVTTLRRLGATGWQSLWRDDRSG